MASKRGMSYRKRVEDINRIFDQHAKSGLTNREIWRRYIYLEELLVAAILCHFAELKHSAGLYVALSVTAQKTEHGINESLGSIVFGQALNVALYHCDAILDSVAVAVDGVHTEDDAQGAVGIGERVAVLIVTGNAGNLGLHLEDCLEVAKDSFLDQFDLVTQFAELRDRGGYFVIHHVGVLLALLFAFLLTTLFFFFGSVSLEFLTLFGIRRQPVEMPEPPKTQQSRQQVIIIPMSMGQA